MSDPITSASVDRKKSLDIIEREVISEEYKRISEDVLNYGTLEEWLEFAMNSHYFHLLVVIYDAEYALDALEEIWLSEH